ncbi:Guanine nucleotide-binding protein G/G/G subunit gamma-13 [Plecturocebus cupreus]
MEEWDVPQMKKEVESLKYQLAYQREMASKTIPDHDHRRRAGAAGGPRGPGATPHLPPAHLPTHRLLKWIEDGIPKDPFLNPDLMKNNPWVEKGKCTVL